MNPMSNPMMAQMFGGMGGGTATPPRNTGTPAGASRLGLFGSQQPPPLAAQAAAGTRAAHQLQAQQLQQALSATPQGRQALQAVP